MKKIFFYLIILFIGSSACRVSKKIQADPAINQKGKDTRANEMLIGKCSRSALLETPFKEWFAAQYNAYKADSFSCTFIKPLLADKTITIFMGTWCGDSKREVPRVLKVLDCCGFPEERITLVMVSNLPDAYKKSPQHEEAGRNIARVPTIIVEEKGKEMGRIIEFPVVSLEKDMLGILRQEKYVPNHHQLKATSK